MNQVSAIDGIAVPTAAMIAAARAELAPWIAETPVFARRGIGAGPEGAVLQFKFELLQNAGTFKARGAFANILALDDAQRARGVTAISAGNHAIAVAYAAQKLGVPAKVVMLASANPARLALARACGAEVLLAPDGAAGFAMVGDIQAREGKFFVHPFNGLRTILGTATLGAEWVAQSGGLDAVVLPIGGGGLAAGVATAFKLLMPGVAVYGVEPAGAAGMAQSFSTGGPVKMGAMASIADSLCAPHTEAYSYGLCRAAIDALVSVDDDALRAAMRLLFDELKLAVEPACAAATAAACGPLRDRLAGQRVGVLLCGSNTDMATFTRHMTG
ncbi:MAG: pyridoxal-phosphate dependent enzyme [Acetobacteraceae bacterium]|nr:pyridoxal-phosphate dependent enzyme [Acetobacteraceae bacterium]